MGKHLVHLINAGMLIVLFIGFPAITGRNLGSWRISSHSLLHQLTAGGLWLGIGVNIVLAWAVFRTRKERRLCLAWAILLGLLLFVLMGQAAGWIHFGWLRDWLFWGRGLLGRIEVAPVGLRAGATALLALSGQVG
jgi:cell division protein FtsW (lipid II flippase)